MSKIMSKIPYILYAINVHTLYSYRHFETLSIEVRYGMLRMNVPNLQILVLDHSLWTFMKP